MGDIQLTTELTIAIWGAVLSTVAIAWNLIRAWLERSRLRISCDIRMTVEPSVGGTARIQLYWHIVNAGSTDIVVTHVCGAMQEKPKEFFTSHFTPVRLKPGDTTHCVAAEYPNPNDIRSLDVSDSLGRPKIEESSLFMCCI